MLSEDIAKKILNYIYYHELSVKYIINPFEDSGQLDKSEWNDISAQYENTDNIIYDIICNYKECHSHIYIKPEKIPNSLKKMGYLVNIDDVEDGYFCGRECEIEKINVLRHKIIKNNVILVGEPGTGKTTLVETYAKRYKLRNVFCVECAKLISNTEYRGAFEQKVIEMIKYAKNMQLILFFDEIHTLLQLGKTTGGISITDILKPYLLDSQLNFIGATTIKEAELLVQDEAFKRRFSFIVLGEPTKDTLIEIKNKFETKIAGQKILENKEASEVIVRLDKELPNQYFPDKLVDFLDYIYAFMKVKGKIINYKQLLEEYICDQKYQISN